MVSGSSIGRVGEESNGADAFVGALSGETDDQIELLPMVGWFAVLPLAHLRPSSTRGGDAGAQAPLLRHSTYRWGVRSAGLDNND